MQFLSSLFLLASLIYSVSAHTTMSYPLPRSHIFNPNTLFKDYTCLTSPLNGGVGCLPKPFPCGGYPVDTKFSTVLIAGQKFNVTFYNPAAPNPDSSTDQARHNGGLCEFALSYNGGKTWTKIATYHKTCPDVLFGWTVKIPENAPTCDTLGQCIFSWSWINAAGNLEFYQNCADVKIIGKSITPLPEIDITKANLPDFEDAFFPEGDPSNSGNAKGSGPLAKDIAENLKPFPTKPEPEYASETIKCVEDKKSPYYIVYNNGKKTTHKCKGTKVCHQKDNNIVCKK
ncbi:3495_t:CDS:1 [Diversispora eburnea]|uniref:3495_t:CDS:1 n=1 Tax=Diversispora eburnea TaxID=1213867 RepID=A0A9N9BAY9_9GLOM|nr:3495_t:CDS:1 [Diversispora eburnea]